MDLKDCKETLIALYKPTNDTERAVIEAIITTAWQSGFESAQSITLKGLDQIDKLIKN